MHWMIDQKIDANAIAEKAEWHLATTIDRLESAGLTRDDAEAFAHFVFADHAEIRDTEPEEYVTTEQWDRLNVA